MIAFSGLVGVGDLWICARGSLAPLVAERAVAGAVLPLQSKSEPSSGASSAQRGLANASFISLMIR